MEVGLESFAYRYWQQMSTVYQVIDMALAVADDRRGRD